MPAPKIVTTAASALLVAFYLNFCAWRHTVLQPMSAANDALGTTIQNHKSPLRAASFQPEKGR
jgi:hypothetical protein